MKPDKQQLQEAEYIIYPNFWKNILLSLGCLIFAIIGILQLLAGKNDFIAWACILFFGIGGIYIIALSLHNYFQHIPAVIIYKDRVERCTPAKNNHIVYFKDVERFRLGNVSSSKQIIIDYKPEVLENRFNSASIFKKSILQFNQNKVGGIESIPVDNLQIKPAEISKLLDQQIHRYNDSN